jgi:hypothetical protein
MFRKQFYFVVSGLKIIGHGNPNNNLETLCISVPSYLEMIQNFIQPILLSSVSSRGTGTFIYRYYSHQASYSMDHRGSSPRVKKGSLSCSPLSSVKIWNVWTFTRA